MKITGAPMSNLALILRVLYIAYERAEERISAWLFDDPELFRHLRRRPFDRKYGIDSRVG